MRNIISYAEEMFETFEERPFSSVDSLIFSQLSYIHIPAAVDEAYSWEGAALKELYRAEDFSSMFRGIWDGENTQRLLTVLAASPRFRDVKIKGFCEQLDREKEKQFAAMSFQYRPEECCIAFRGTDSTLVGWKEDFNMAFKCPIPAQEEAVRYLTEAAYHCTGRIRVSGHSKGGNLAVYAAAKCGPALQDEIVKVYSHDGPGFLAQVLESPDFARVIPKVDKTLPRSSIVGMLLENQEEYRIVKSGKLSFWQHNPFSWELEGNSFCLEDKLTFNARYLDRTLTDWVYQLSEEERERFVDALFGVLSTTDLSTFGEMKNEWQKTVPAVVKAAAQLDGETREFLFRVLKELAATGIRNVPEMLREEREALKLPEKT